MVPPKLNFSGIGHAPSHYTWTKVTAFHSNPTTYYWILVGSQWILPLHPFSPCFVQTSPCLPIWSHHHWILLGSHWILLLCSISSCICMHIIRICSNLLRLLFTFILRSFVSFMYIHMRWIEYSTHMTNPIYMHMHCDGTYMFTYIYPFTYMFQIWFPMYITMWSFTCIQLHLFQTTNKNISSTSLIANIKIWIIGSCMH